MNTIIDSEGLVNMNLFNKSNPAEKKELYKKIILEALEIIREKETNYESFKAKVMNGSRSFKTKLALSKIMRSLIQCIGKFESHYNCDWDITTAFSKLRQTFKELDDDGNSKIFPNRNLNESNHFKSSHNVDYDGVAKNFDLNISRIESLQKHIKDIGIKINDIYEENADETDQNKSIFTPSEKSFFQNEKYIDDDASIGRPISAPIIHIQPSNKNSEIPESQVLSSFHINQKDKIPQKNHDISNQSNPDQCFTKLKKSELNLLNESDKQNYKKKQNKDELEMSLLEQQIGKCEVHSIRSKLFNALNKGLDR